MKQTFQGRVLLKTIYTTKRNFICRMNHVTIFYAYTTDVECLHNKMSQISKA